MSKQNGVESKVREIRRKTRKRYSAEEKIRIVLEGLRGEESITALCRREGIATNLYYSWSKEFLEAGKRRLMGDTKRQPKGQRRSREGKCRVGEEELEEELIFGSVGVIHFVVLEESGDGPGPYGSRGIGEGGILPAAPAICLRKTVMISLQADEVIEKGDYLVVIGENEDLDRL